MRGNGPSRLFVGYHVSLFLCLFVSLGLSQGEYENYADVMCPWLVEKYTDRPIPPDGRPADRMRPVDLQRTRRSATGTLRV